MKRLTPKLIAVLAALVVMLAAGFAVFAAQSPSSYVGCESYEKAIQALKTERAFTLSQSGKDGLETRLAEVREQAANDPKCNPEPTTEPTEEEVVVEENLTFPHFFYYDPDKVGPYDFGTPIEGSNEEMVAEYHRRLALDPALLCITAERVLGSVPTGTVYRCAVELAAHQAAHDALLAEVYEQIENIVVGQRPAGNVDSTYMVDVDGYPSALVIRDVARPETYDIFELRLRDGRIVYSRPLCGGQIEESITTVDQLPAGEEPAVAARPDDIVEPAEQPTTESAVAPSTTTPREEPTTKPSTEPTEEPTTKPTEAPKDQSLDPANQDNIPDSLRDGSDVLPSAEGCINGGTRNRNGVCEAVAPPAVEQGEAENASPVQPPVEVAEDIEAPAVSEPEAQPAPEAPAPTPAQPETGNADANQTREEADANDGEDNALGQTERG